MPFNFVNMPEQRKCGGTGLSMRRIVLPATLRIIVGYVFLACLFLVVVQEDDVLDIFFDILALEFVENIDDVVFSLSKRGKLKKGTQSSSS